MKYLYSLNSMTQHSQHPHGTRHARGDRPGHGPASDHDTGLAELLDLDAELGATVLAEALDAASAALGTAPHVVVDLGAGTGTGTLALATRFADARVHSLDASPAMLDRLRAATAVGELADRVDPHLVDLDGDWPAALPGHVDLAWAALSLHHVTEPNDFLRQVFDVLRPGGVLVVTEFSGETTFAPADLGTNREGLGPRLVAALAERGYPVTGEWTSALSAAGFAPVQRLAAELTASGLTAQGARYLSLHLRRNRELLADELDREDMASLDAAIAQLEAGTSPLEFSSGRTIWIAVRPTHHTSDTESDTRS